MAADVVTAMQHTNVPVPRSPGSCASSEGIHSEARDRAALVHVTRNACSSNILFLLKLLPSPKKCFQIVVLKFAHFHVTVQV